MEQILGSLLVGILLMSMVGLIIFSRIKAFKKGKPICGGDCSRCHGACNHGEI